MTDQLDDMTEQLDEMGPIDYIVVEFPGNRMTGEAFPLLVDLVDLRPEDGTLDLAVFEGASSGLLGEDDISQAAEALEPNSSAGVLVFENLWAAPFARAVRRGGGQLVASGRIPVQAVLSALDEAEQAG